MIVLYIMLYIVMCSSINLIFEYVYDMVFKVLIMFIEYYVVKKDECRIMERIMCWLEVKFFEDCDIVFFYCYIVNKFFYFVFNILEIEGFNVVGINSVLNFLIWIL